jgi:hypothetical protein
LTGGAVAISFCCRLILPIQDPLHPAFEYSGQSDPTRVIKRKVSKGEMAARVKDIFSDRIRNRECPKALGVYHPSEAVSLSNLVCIHNRSQAFLTQVSLFVMSCFQYREGIYLCPAPLRNEEQRSYKVRDAAYVHVAPRPPIEEYISNSSVGSDDEAPAARRTPSKVAAPRRTRQETRKIPASRAAAMIAATQTAEAKKKKRKRTRSTVSVDTTTVSSGVETIEVDGKEGDTESPGTTAASTEEQAMEMPCQMSATKESPWSSSDTVGDLGSHKRARKAPPKPCKLSLRSATK